MRVPQGIRTIPLPTMLPIGLVNVYLLEGEPLTLIDTGPRTEDSEAALRKGLKTLGHAVDDLEQILLTHGHVDHTGLAEALRRDSGAKLLVPENDRPIVERFEETFAARRKRFCDALLRSGAPEGTCDLVDDFMEWVQSLGGPARVDGSIRDRDLIRAGRFELKAFHTPGHSAGSTCFLEPDGVLFSGDTIIREVTPNAVFGGADGVSLGLGDYLASLRRLRALPVTDILPGHREPFRDVKQYAAEYQAKFAERQAEIVRLLKQGPQTPFDLVIGLFGTLPIQEVLLGVTEVLGHLEVLTSEGLVASDEKPGQLVFGLVTPSRPRHA